MDYDSVACIGIGAMGAAMGESFLKAGLTVHAWNRTQDRAELTALVNQGAILEKDPGSAIQQCQIAVICVLDYDSVYSILNPIDRSIFKDKTIVNLTTASALEGEKMNSWIHDRGAIYFDGAIMKIPQHVGLPHAFTFIAGESAEAFSKIEKPLSSIGSLDYLGSDPSSSAIYDNALLAGMYGMFGGCLIAIALLNKAKKPPTADGRGVRSSVETVKNKLLPALAGINEWVVEAADCYEKKGWRGYTATNEVLAHALENVVQTCDAFDVETDCMLSVKGLFDKAMREGKGPNGLGVLISYLSK